jgi:hypothetical protein
MWCRKYRFHLTVPDEKRAAQQVQKAREHAGLCPACKRFAELMTRTVRAVRTTSEPTAPTDFNARLALRLAEVKQVPPRSAGIGGLLETLLAPAPGLQPRTVLASVILLALLVGGMAVALYPGGQRGLAGQAQVARQTAPAGPEAISSPHQGHPVPTHNVSFSQREVILQHQTYQLTSPLRDHAGSYWLTRATAPAN